MLTKALERAPYNQDGDDDVIGLEWRKNFREHGWCKGVKDRPQVVRNTSKAPGYYFLLGNVRSASAMKVELEATTVGSIYRRVCPDEAQELLQMEPEDPEGCANVSQESW